jgi:hypothetical protein
MYSALPLTTDIAQQGPHVRSVPETEVAALIDDLVGGGCAVFRRRGAGCGGILACVYLPSVCLTLRTAAAIRWEPI